MKELKFRVWDKVRQKMFKPQAISFDTQTLAPFAVSVPGRSWEPAEKFDLLQWTGLSDAKGSNVYEGDVISISSVMYQVIWNKSIGGFELLEAGSSFKRNIIDVGIGEIVGDPYQNVPLTVTSGL
ncbi:YopX family protein [Desulfosporosinus sp. SYSU MS00001]|uniref:YopX family protein n=1 Tax=Desulfosporosinus sp. SYSU MS00001 TaxID=3416284 RepID=UPI003CFB960B